MNNFIHDEEGVVAIEFAIILPIMLTVLMATIGFGSYFITKGAMQQAASEAAWRLATDKLSTNNASTWVASKLPPYVSSTVTVTSPDYWDPHPYYEVHITVSIVSVKLADPFNLFAGIGDLEASAAFGVPSWNPQ